MNSDEKQLGNMSVAELKTICKNLNMKNVNKMKKSDMIEIIKSESKSKSSEDSQSNKNSQNNKIKLKCDDGTNKNKCVDNQICRTSDGKCIKKTTKQRPWSENNLKTKFGSEYYFDSKYKIVGSKMDVLEHINSWSGVENKSCGDPGMKNLDNYKKCEEFQICNIVSGKCEEDNSRNRKNKLILDVKGHNIAGDAKSIDHLKNVLGGSIRNTANLEFPINDVGVIEKNEIRQIPTTKYITNVTVTAERENVKDTFIDCLNRLK